MLFAKSVARVSVNLGIVVAIYLALWYVFVLQISGH